MDAPSDHKLTTQAANIILRPAHPGDADMLRYWDTQPHVIQADPNDDWHWDEELQNPPVFCELLIAEQNGRPIGFVQIIDPAKEETHYWGEVPDNLRAIDIWIGEPSDLGKGYGTTMMKQAIDRCFSDENVVAILIDPLATNTRAHRFYERLGFKFVRKQTLGQDDCFVYRLDRP